jgi:8-oxo-dGTP pyrophosphatase MutT (NUDIX family)
MENLRSATLVFLLQKSDECISHVCLAMKKQGFGSNRWNGAGGKVEAGETIEEAAKREAKEEIGVTVTNMQKVAELSFFFPHNAAWNQCVHAYLSFDWTGVPVESNEMKPAWFPIAEIPYGSMWSSDKFWLPAVLAGKLVKANITFGEKDIVQKHEVNFVTEL